MEEVSSLGDTDTVPELPGDGKTPGEAVALINPYADIGAFLRARSEALQDPGRFHGEIAIREIHFYAPETDAWITWDDRSGTWQAIGADGRPVPVGLLADYRPWQQGFVDKEAPFYRWFVGAQTNACFNEVDRHVALGKGAEVAFYFEGDRWDPSLNEGRGGPQTSFAVSRKQLLLEVAKAALVLQGLGLGPGDRIVLNLPNIMEQIYYTQAAKRLGIVYTPIFGGLSAKTVSDRLEDLGARVIVTADGGYRNAQIVPYKEAYTDPALDGFLTARSALRIAQEVARGCLPPDLAGLLGDRYQEAVAGEITLSPADAMRFFGQTLDDLDERVSSADRAALRSSAAKAMAAPERRVDAVVVVRHTRQEIGWREGRDVWSHDLLAQASALLLSGARSMGFAVQSEKDLLSFPDGDFLRAVWASSRPLPVEANFPLFAIYTSGSTGKPKGVVHVHGSTAGVAHTMKVSFDCRPGDVLYVIADPGWITGQSYMISAALTTAVPSVVAEGAPVFPTAGRFASIIERYGVTIFKAGATFLKTILADPGAKAEVLGYRRDSLRVATFCAEPVSPVVQRFAMDLLCPHYINSYWATEHGGIVWTHLYGNRDLPLRPDAHTFPLPWIQGDVWVPEGADEGGRVPYRRAEDGEKGEIVIASPYPYLARTIWGDADDVLSPDWRGDVTRYAKTYWERWSGVHAYTQGDFACRYPDGSFSLHGRSDDVINVAGHRIGTEEIEGALLRDRQRNLNSVVRNAVVVGAPHAGKGLVPVAFIQTPGGRKLTDADRRRLDDLVRTEKGSVAVPADYIEVSQFPETRSGKYMRRLFADLLRGDPPGDTQSLKNPEAITEVRPLVDAWRRKEQLVAEQQVIERYRFLRVQYLPVGKDLAEVALVTIDHPPVNSLNERALDELLAVVERLASRDGVRAVVFTGAGKSFVAGADVRQLLEEMQDVEDVLPLSRKAQLVFSAIEAMTKPCVAAIRGVALGGGNEFQMATHYSVAEPTARFGQPEINLRLLPGYGGTQRLPRLMQAASGEAELSRALEIILSGRSIDAEEALSLGLIAEICRDQDALSRALSLAREYALKGDGPLKDALQRRRDLVATWDRPAQFPTELLDGPEIRRILSQHLLTGRHEAAERVLEAVRAGIEGGIRRGLALEADLFAKAVVDPHGGVQGIRDFLDRKGPSLPARPRFAPTGEEEEELVATGQILPEGSPFHPGFTPLPAWQYAYGIVRSLETGEPEHGDPLQSEKRCIIPVPRPGPSEALVYVLASDVNFNDIWAATGIPVSPFDAHDEDIHVSGSGGVGLVAAMGEELRREGRLRMGDLVTIYPGQSELMSPEAGLDPMAADFRIQGYETPDGSHQQFMIAQGPQLLPKPKDAAIEASAGYLLALGTVYRALYTTLDVQPGRTLFAEGAATGTGYEAIKCAAQGGLTAAGMVSTDERERTARAAGARVVLRRDDPRLRDAFTPVPRDPGLLAAWEEKGRPLLKAFRAQNGGRLADYVVSHAGQTSFPRSFQLLEDGGALTFFGASSGYHFTFLGKPGSRPPEEMLRRAGLHQGDGVAVYYGTDCQDEAGVVDEVGLQAVEAARSLGARIALITYTDAQAEFVESLGYGDAVAGTVSIEGLLRSRGKEFTWPETMPGFPDPRQETAAFKEAQRHFQEHVFKPVGESVGKLLRTSDNPRGQPDVVFERSGHDALAVSVMLLRPLTGRVVYAESLAGKRYSFFAPQLWMRQRRILMPTASILGSHLCNAYEATQVNAGIEAGRFHLTDPVLVPFDDLPGAHQAMWENRHTGASYIVNHALPRPGLKSLDDLYAAWAANGD